MTPRNGLFQEPSPRSILVAAGSLSNSEVWGSFAGPLAICFFELAQLNLSLPLAEVPAFGLTSQGWHSQRPRQCLGVGVRMLVIGVVGGIASGKSFVAQEFAVCGAAVLDADRIGHEVLTRSEVKQQIREQWGDRVFDARGEVDRARLAAVVFEPGPESEVQLRRLETITHPSISAELQRRLDELRAAEQPAVVLDAAVMFKSGWHRLCDKIVFVEVPDSMRMERAAARGWTVEQLRQREARQTALEEKRRWADALIDNSGSEQATRLQVAQLWQRWCGVPCERRAT